MDSNELLKGIQQRDTDAYLYLTQTYGWKLYAHLSEKLNDTELTNRAFNDTLSSFYDCLAGSRGDDAVESLLYAFADRTCRDLNREAVPAAIPEQKKQPAKNRNVLATILFWITAVILIVGIVAALWVIAALLMDMGFLPKVDLGYEWVRSKLSGWF